MSDKIVKIGDGGALAEFDASGMPMPSALAEALHRQGISPSVVAHPDVVHHAKVKWEDLCVLRTRDRKTMVSPILVITLVDDNIDAPQDFAGYRGVVRFEFTNEFGGTQFATHAMTYADTGELTPLWAWLKQQTPPFVARLGYIETRDETKHVVRPVPLDIEIV